MALHFINCQWPAGLTSCRSSRLSCYLRVKVQPILTGRDPTLTLPPTPTHRLSLSLSHTHTHTHTQTHRKGNPPPPSVPLQLAISMGNFRLGFKYIETFIDCDCGLHTHTHHTHTPHATLTHTPEHTPLVLRALLCSCMGTRTTRGVQQYPTSPHHEVFVPRPSWRSELREPTMTCGNLYSVDWEGLLETLLADALVL